MRGWTASPARSAGDVVDNRAGTARQVVGTAVETGEVVVPGQHRHIGNPMPIDTRHKVLPALVRIP